MEWLSSAGALLRKVLLSEQACSCPSGACVGPIHQEGDASSALEIEIGPPQAVTHELHVTFNCASGFVGLPDHLRLQLQDQPPSHVSEGAVFGVAPESLECSYDDHGNSVPRVLLALQTRLYGKQGLQSEGIFRVSGEMGDEDGVRQALAEGTVPEHLDVHALAGLIKAWFRELPSGILDSVTPEAMAAVDGEEAALAILGSLPPVQVSLLDWAVNLMTDVVECERENRMNSRNIAMVFAPNMTQVVDPLVGLQHAVKVMDFLNLLILRKQQDRTSACSALMQPSALDDSDCDTDSIASGYSSLLSPRLPRGTVAGPTGPRARKKVANQSQQQGAGEGDRGGTALGPKKGARAGGMGGESSSWVGAAGKQRKGAGGGGGALGPKQEQQEQDGSEQAGAVVGEVGLDSISEMCSVGGRASDLGSEEERGGEVAGNEPGSGKATRRKSRLGAETREAGEDKAALDGGVGAGAAQEREQAGVLPTRSGLLGLGSASPLLHPLGKLGHRHGEGDNQGGSGSGSGSHGVRHKHRGSRGNNKGHAYSSGAETDSGRGGGGGGRRRGSLMAGSGTDTAEAMYSSDWVLEGGGKGGVAGGGRRQHPRSKEERERDSALVREYELTARGHTPKGRGRPSRGTDSRDTGGVRRAHSDKVKGQEARAESAPEEPGGGQEEAQGGTEQPKQQQQERPSSERQARVRAGRGSEGGGHYAPKKKGSSSLFEAMSYFISSPDGSPMHQHGTVDRANLAREVLERRKPKGERDSSSTSSSSKGGVSGTAAKASTSSPNESSPPSRGSSSPAPDTSVSARPSAAERSRISPLSRFRKEVPERPSSERKARQPATSAGPQQRPGTERKSRHAGEGARGAERTGGGSKPSASSGKQSAEGQEAQSRRLVRSQSELADSRAEGHPSGTTPTGLMSEPEGGVGKNQRPSRVPRKANSYVERHSGGLERPKSERLSRASMSEQQQQHSGEFFTAFGRFNLAVRLAAEKKLRTSTVEGRGVSRERRRAEGVDSSPLLSRGEQTQTLPQAGAERDGQAWARTATGHRPRGAETMSSPEIVASRSTTAHSARTTPEHRRPARPTSERKSRGRGVQRVVSSDTDPLERAMLSERKGNPSRRSSQGQGQGHHGEARGMERGFSFDVPVSASPVSSLFGSGTSRPTSERKARGGFERVVSADRPPTSDQRMRSAQARGRSSSIKERSAQAQPREPGGADVGLIDAGWAKVEGLDKKQALFSL